MTKLLTNSALKEKANELRSKRSNFALRYSDKAALYSELINDVNKQKKISTKKKANYLGHYLNHPRLVLGKDTRACRVLTLNPCKEYKGSSFISQWGYCAETNVLKLTMGKYKYYYLHVTPKDMKRAEDYTKFHYFYNQEIKGRKDCIKV